MTQIEMKCQPTPHKNQFAQLTLGGGVCFFFVFFFHTSVFKDCETEKLTRDEVTDFTL